MRIYTPSKTANLLKEAKKQLYLLKIAIKGMEKEEKLNVHIDSIRKLLIEAGATL